MLPYQHAWEAPTIFKITNVEGPKQFRIVVEGRLVPPWTTELRIACDEARSYLHGRELVVELKHVMAISREGENTLLDLMNRGATVCGSGLFTKHILKQLARRARTTDQKETR